MNLRLDDEVRGVEGAGNRFGLSGVLATAPGGVATPNFCMSSLAWYSWMFMTVGSSGDGNFVKGEDACDLQKRTEGFYVSVRRLYLKQSYNITARFKRRQV